jgi:hypothetical protein
MNKNYIFKCPKCGCNRLECRTRLITFAEISSITKKRIAKSDLIYYDYDVVSASSEQPDESYGEHLVCYNCEWELDDIEEAINDNILMIKDV